ncbi:MAG: FAD binding domain-containing protein [Sandarakinorhabdus sp.]|nr:FAD binding domain-containing protein [Sandarakinorhabdus sp.]
MTPFDLKRPKSLSEARSAFSGDAAFLAGGHTLIPAIKSRLRMVETLVDLSSVPGLDSISAEGDRLIIGAMARHAAVAASPVTRNAIPGLAALASGIGDPQVRNRGTIGGSVANNDPAADYPAALLALDAVVETSHGSHAAEDFFQGMFATALADGELITRISLRIPLASAYAKHPHPASRYALAGVYVAKYSNGVRVAVTGATTGVMRWPEAEAAIASGASLQGLSLLSDDLASDIHASAAFRAHLAGVMLRKAAAAAA